MIDLFAFVAVLASGLFAGAALYINVAEHPARMRLGTAHAVEQWGPSYQRATLMQAPLALISALSGAVVSFMGAGVSWAVAAVLIGAVVPFTLIVIMPVNRKLQSPELNRDSQIARDLLVRWGRLHSVRTVLSLAAAALYCWLLLR
jgi:uncharacterized membrane protein